LCTYRSTNDPYSFIRHYEINKGTVSIRNYTNTQPTPTKIQQIKISKAALYKYQLIRLKVKQSRSISTRKNQSSIVFWRTSRFHIGRHSKPSKQKGLGIALKYRRVTNSDRVTGRRTITRPVQTLHCLIRLVFLKLCRRPNFYTQFTSSITRLISWIDRVRNEVG